MRRVPDLAPTTVSAVQLTFGIGEGSSLSPAPSVVIDSLQSVKVSATSGNEPSGFELVFSVGRLSSLVDVFTSMDKSHSGDVRVSIGLIVRGVTTILIDGVMTHQEVVQNDGSATLLVKGYDLTAVMDRTRPGPKREFQYAESMRVREILNRYLDIGLEFDIRDPNNPTQPGGAPTADSLGQPVPAKRAGSSGGVNPTSSAGPGAVDHRAVQDGTDYAYVRDLAKEIGWIFAVIPSTFGKPTAYWGPELRDGTLQRSMTAELDPLNRSVMSLSFTYDRARKEVGVINDERGSTRFPVPPEQRMFAGWSPSEYTTAVIERSADVSPERAERKARGHSITHNDVLFGKGTLSVARYGDVLTPRSTVGVRGAGPANDGIHFITKVETTIRRGEVTQAFELARDGLYSKDAANE